MSTKRIKLKNNMKYEDVLLKNQQLMAEIQKLAGYLSVSEFRNDCYSKDALYATHERNIAQREVCELICKLDMAKQKCSKTKKSISSKLIPEDVARNRGWDCFDEESE